MKSAILIVVRATRGEYGNMKSPDQRDRYMLERSTHDSHRAITHHYPRLSRHICSCFMVFL